MEKIHTEAAPAAIGPYSQAITNGGLVYTSGQIAIDPLTNTLIDGGISEQTRRVIMNLGEVLASAGSSYDKVIKTTCFLADMKDFSVFNEIYGEYFKNHPARSCVAVKELPKGALVEIEVIAKIN